MTSRSVPVTGPLRDARRIREHLEANDGVAPKQRTGATGGAHIY